MHNTSTNTGSALVTLLIFMIVAISVTTMATMVLINTTRSSNIINTSNLAQSTAESGAENAILRLLRDPNYAGETLAVGQGTATITVTGTTTKTITSVGVYGNFKQTTVVTASYVNNVFTVTSWQQTY